MLPRTPGRLRRPPLRRRRHFWVDEALVFIQRPPTQGPLGLYLAIVQYRSWKKVPQLLTRRSHEKDGTKAAFLWNCPDSRRIEHLAEYPVREPWLPTIMH